MTLIMVTSLVRSWVEKLGYPIDSAGKITVSSVELIDLMMDVCNVVERNERESQLKIFREALIRCEKKTTGFEL